MRKACKSIETPAPDLRRDGLAGAFERAPVMALIEKALFAMPSEGAYWQAKKASGLKPLPWYGGSRVETYPIDLEASQIVRWLIDEQRRGTLQVNVAATRSYVVEAFERADLAQMGEDAADLNDVLAIATLEVRSAGGKNSWVLRIRVEDRVGPRLPEDEDAPDGEEGIDLQTFEADFIKPDPDAAEVTLEAENAHAKANFTKLFNHMLRNEHGAKR